MSTLKITQLLLNYRPTVKDWQKTEPNIFDFGWKRCNNMLIQLAKNNKDFTIL